MTPPVERAADKHMLWPQPHFNFTTADFQAAGKPYAG